ncbi:hypothetical protein [Falsiroseomonas sp. E2-1-a20]|uniref:hypothetical protein n=1 Tax=Falsiroseomonas sp. E2-1-a20 TaxID=3239300 RepID=UPI003F3D4BDB
MNAEEALNVIARNRPVDKMGKTLNPLDPSSLTAALRAKAERWDPDHGYQV